MDSPQELKALYQILLQRWRLVVGCTLASVLLGVVVCLVTPKQYQSHGRLLVMQKLAKFVGDKGKVLDPKAYDSLFATHLQLIGSPRIVQQAVDTYELEKLASLTDDLEEDETVVDRIVEELAVKRAGSGDADGAFVIRLEYKHSDADDAKAVVAAILETYRQYVQRSTLDGQAKAVSIISEMESKVAADVERKSKAYRDYLNSAPGIWNRQTLENPHQGRIDKLQTELTDWEIKKTGITSRIQILKAANSDEYTDLDRLALIDDMHVNRLALLVSVKSDELSEFFQSKYPERQEHASTRYDQLLTLQREKSTLAENVGASHPAMIQLDADIETVKQRLSQNQPDIESPHDELRIHPSELVRAYQRLLVNDLEDVKRHIAFVEATLKKEQKAAKRIRDVSLEGERLQHEYERSRELYQSMLGMLQEQSLVNDFGDYVAEVLANPKQGEQVWPNLPMMCAIFMMLGFLGGVVLALGLEWMPQPKRKRRIDANVERELVSV